MKGQENAILDVILFRDFVGCFISSQYIGKIWHIVFFKSWTVGVMFNGAATLWQVLQNDLAGMVGLNPDYLLCTVDANRGEMRGMVHEHLVVAHALAIPTIICLTKCDMASEDQKAAALLDVKRFMKQLGTQTLVVKDSNDAVLAAERILQGYTPIFLCSAVTGAMMPELKLLLNVISRRPAVFKEKPQLPTAEPVLQIQIDEFFPQVQE